MSGATRSSADCAASRSGTGSRVIEADDGTISGRAVGLLLRQPVQRLMQA
jgi:hypothetical protein